MSSVTISLPRSSKKKLFTCVTPQGEPGKDIQWPFRQALCNNLLQQLCPFTGRFMDEFDDGHGRLVRRRAFLCPDAAALEPGSTTGRA